MEEPPLPLESSRICPMPWWRSAVIMTELPRSLKLPVGFMDSGLTAT